MILEEDLTNTPEILLEFQDSQKLKLSANQFFVISETKLKSY